jgi:hypothetical protein
MWRAVNTARHIIASYKLLAISTPEDPNFATRGFPEVPTDSFWYGGFAAETEDKIRLCYSHACTVHFPMFL